MTAQERKLLGSLDALGNNLQLEVMSHGYHCRGDFHVVLIGGNLMNEAAVDFEDVDRKLLQVAK
ncbi:hypothetical protein D3C77_746070 [compost metagenome]